MFDTKKHVEDHAYKVVDNLIHDDEKLVHFNTSAEISYFIAAGFTTQDEINHIMVQIMDSLLQKELIREERNGIYINKNGDKIQKYRKRKIVFTDILMAYHDKHFDASKSVSPHFHVLCTKKSRIGKNFLYLREALAEEANKYNIKFNFMEEKQKSGLSSTKLNYLERMSWLFHQGDEEKIYDFIQNNRDGFKRNLDSLITHYQHTNNLSFFIKTLLIVNQRLNELNLDYIYNDINLKVSLFFFLLPSDIRRIEVLKQGGAIAISTDSVFDRELLKFAYGFKTEVMDIIVNKFDIQYIKKEQLLIEEKITGNSVKKKNTIKFRDLVIMDIRNAVSIAKSYEDFRSLLTNMEYKKIAMKTSKVRTNTRVNIGINIITKKSTKMFISFKELRLSWSKMRMIFSHNKKKNKQRKNLVTNLDRYREKNNEINTELIKIEYEVPRLLELYCEEAINDIQIEEFDDYKLERSDMYNITTLINNNNSIVVAKSRITLKKSLGDENSIQDILKLVELKGWDLNKLVVSGKDTYVEKIKLQISQLTKKNENILPVLEENEYILNQNSFIKL